MGFLVSFPTAENSPQNQAQVQVCLVDLLQPKQGHTPGPTPTPPLKLKPIQLLSDFWNNHTLHLFILLQVSLNECPTHDMLNINSANSHQTLPRILHADNEHTPCLFPGRRSEAHRQWKSTRRGGTLRLLHISLEMTCKTNGWVLHEKLLERRKRGKLTILVVCVWGFFFL